MQSSRGRKWSQLMQTTTASLNVCLFGFDARKLNFICDRMHASRVVIYFEFVYLRERVLPKLETNLQFKC